MRHTPDDYSALLLISAQLYADALVAVLSKGDSDYTATTVAGRVLNDFNRQFGLDEI